MCGIAGIIKLNSQDATENDYLMIKEMLLKIHHRGPDQNGIIKVDNIVLGMQRLSIIDAKGGNQPMTEKNGRYTIIFNGEIYNHKNLRYKIQNAGYVFDTESDTEVLLKGVIEYGSSFLNEIEGMFAFAIFDRKEKAVTIGRDRFGKKPLYYYVDKQSFIFCSENYPIVTNKELKLSLNQQAYWDYLTYRYIPGEQTSVSNVFKIKRGTFGVIKGNSFEFNKFCDFPTFEDNNHSTRRIEKNFGALFQKSVQKRLISDFPIGVILSGGIDSCAVLYEASKHQKINSYHVYFNTDNDHNELKYAEMMANFCKSELRAIELSNKTFYDLLEKLPVLTDEPLSDLAAIPLKIVCDLASRDVKTVLSGEGADEVLAGYGLEKVFMRIQLLKLLNLNKSVSSKLLLLMEIVLRRKIKLKNELGFKSKDWPISQNYNITNQINESDKKNLLINLYEFEDSTRYLKKTYNKVKSEDPINQILQAISTDWLTENVLMKSDKVSMSSSIELRCPFMDHTLVNYLFKLNGKSKVGFYNKKFVSKLILKKYLNGKIPQQLIDRPKLGFPVPAYLLNDASSKQFVSDILFSQNCFYQNFFSRYRIEDIFDRTTRLQPNTDLNNKHFLWSLVNYELWYNQHKGLLST